jgi:hypothetical protein
MLLCFNLAASWHCLILVFHVFYEVFYWDLDNECLLFIFYEVFYWDLDNEKKLDFIVSKRLKKRGSKLKKKKKILSFFFFIRKWGADSVPSFFIFPWLLLFCFNLFFNIMLIEI